VDTTFQAWIGANNATILLVSGKPGSGKSVLARHVIEKLRLHRQHSHESAVAYFFFSGRGERIEEETAGMLRAMLYQILHDAPLLFDKIPIMHQFNELKDQNRNGEVEWPLDILKDLFLSLRFQEVIKTFYLIIDSLDESEAEHSAYLVCDILRELCLDSQAAQVECKFKVLLTSRPKTFSETLDGRFENCPRISLELHTKADIETYVSNRINSFLTHLQGGLRPLRDIIIRRADGVFLWVNLVMERLKKRSSKGDNLEELEEVVKTLPNEMEKLYRNILGEVVEGGDIEERSIMFQWVLFAERPLTLAEFQTAVKINRNYPNSDRISMARLSDGSPRFEDLKRRILSRSGGLLECKEDTHFSEERGTFVQFIHQSAKDFIHNNEDTWSSPHIMGFKLRCNSEIAWCCLKYLSLCEFERPTEDQSWYDMDSVQYKQRLQEYCFLSYASKHWPKHTFEATDQDENTEFDQNTGLWNAFEEMTQSRSKVSSAFQILQRERHGLYCQDITPLHVVSGLGLLFFVAHILERMAERMVSLDQRDSFGRTALHYAAGGGHERPVTLLLTMNADIEAQDIAGGTPLISAIDSGSGIVVELLLSKGARVDFRFTTIVSEPSLQ
jgi:ankyrin repeat domain-containing protein 50